MKQAHATDLQAQAARLGVALDRGQVRTFLRYEELLVDHAAPIGLIAEGDVGKIRSRHVLDCLRAAPLVAGASEAYDLGSGAGLPGLVIAIACPELQVRLVETRRRAIALLELAVERLGLSNATLDAHRAESLARLADVCLARAFAPLPRAWEVAERLLRSGGRLIYFAGSGKEFREPSEGGGPTARVPSGAAVVEVVHTPVLERAGPLVIMARQ